MKKSLPLLTLCALLWATPSTAQITLTPTRNVSSAGGGAGTGDVVGPASATDDTFICFDGTSGKLIKQCTLNPLTSAAIDTSAELAAILTDENGFGKVIFSTGTLAIASGKTLTISNSFTAVATDGAVLAFGNGGTVVYTGSTPALTGTNFTSIPLAGLVPGSDDGIPVSSGSAYVQKILPDCVDTGGNHLNYTTSTNAFSCGTSGGGGGSFSATDIDTSAELAAIVADESGTGPLLFGTSPTIAAPSITGQISFADNTRQVFNPGANTPGFNFGSQSGAPDTPSDGDAYYDTNIPALRARINGAWVNLGSGGGGGLASTDIDTSAELKAILTDENAPDGSSSKFLLALGSISIASGKTLTVSNSFVMTATDSSTVAFGAGGTVLYTASIDDTAYNATTWNGDTTHAPSKNAIRDLIETFISVSGATTGDMLIGNGTDSFGLVNIGANGKVWKSNGTTASWQDDSTGSGSLGSSLTSATNDIIASTGSSIVFGKSSGEAITFDFNTSNHVVLSSTTGVNYFDFGGLALHNAGLTGDLEMVLGVCQGTTASLGFNIQASGAATVACDGSTIIGALTTFADASTSEIQTVIRIPDSWDGNAMTLKGKFLTSATSGNAIWQVSGKCAAAGAARPTAYSTTPDTATVAAGSANTELDFAITLSTASNHALASCSAGNGLYLRFFRDPSGSDTLGADVKIDQPIALIYGKL